MASWPGAAYAAPSWAAWARRGLRQSERVKRWFKLLPYAQGPAFKFFRDATTNPMNLAAALLAPFTLLLSAVGVTEGVEDEGAFAAESIGSDKAMGSAPDWPIAAMPAVEPEDAYQVRIEQRMTVRITPRAAMPIPPDVFAALRDERLETRFSERKIGKCVPISRIAGVQPNGSGNLILFMRDRSMIKAELERSCRSRDFYSGFYLAPSSDGRLCVDRDTLQSRSGANCKLLRLRELVETDD
jgi:hypothetical protein